MRDFGDWVLNCPKCTSFMGSEAPLKWHEPAITIGDPAGWVSESFTTGRLDVECSQCGWTYVMRPADAQVEVVA